MEKRKASTKVNLGSYAKPSFPTYSNKETVQAATLLSLWPCAGTLPGRELQFSSLKKAKRGL